MVYLIGGATHTGKTVLAQRLLEKLQVPYLSMDHLKMGLIRSGNTALTPMDDEKLTEYLWPIVAEMIKTAIENGQSLIVEGCYIPFTWREAFSEPYLPLIRCRFLVMTEAYIQSRFEDIRAYANAIEQRLDDSGLCKEELIRENRFILEQCRLHQCPVHLLDREYAINPDEFLQEA